MFGPKQRIINGLRIALESKDRKIDFINNQLTDKDRKILDLEVKLKECKCLIDATPLDCKRGAWCQACEFAKKITVSHGYCISDIYLCGKAEACSNFVQKEF